MTEEIIQTERRLDLMRIEKVIKRIRDSFNQSVEVYTSGSCYRFAMILKEIYPYGKILTNESHAIFELQDGRCYDITGLVDKEGHLPLADQGCNKTYDSLCLISDDVKLDKALTKRNLSLLGKQIRTSVKVMKLGDSIELDWSNRKGDPVAYFNNAATAMGLNYKFSRRLVDKESKVFTITRTS